MAGIVFAKKMIGIGTILIMLWTMSNAVDVPDLKSDSEDDDSYLQPHLWSSLLEEWTINPPSTRQGRVMQMAHRYIPTSNMYITKRIGNVAPLGTMHSNQYGNGYTRVTQNGGAAPSEVTETDLYLLSAIEKLVYRVDYMEKRLLKSEQLIYYLMAGNNQNRKEIEENPCSKNFTRIGDNCYLVAIEHPGVNWKTANNICRSYGAQLAELETMNEHNDIVAYLLNHHNLNDYDNFWLGGLNPGLLWIWSSSARPVNANVNLTNIQNASTANAGASTMKINNNNSNNNSHNNNNRGANGTNSTVSHTKPTNATANSVGELEIEGNGRCLGLVYARDKHNYKFYGVECTNRQHFLCELPQKQDRIKKEISRIAKSLFP